MECYPSSGVSEWVRMSSERVSSQGQTSLQSGEDLQFLRRSLKSASRLCALALAFRLEAEETWQPRVASCPEHKELLANSLTALSSLFNIQKIRQAGGGVNPLHSLCTKPSLQLVWMKMSQVESEFKPNHSDTVAYHSAQLMSDKWMSEKTVGFWTPKHKSYRTLWTKREIEWTGPFWWMQIWWEGC